MPNLNDYLLPDGRYYFDNAATTKMSKEALRVYNETAERWFMNPMSYKDFDPAIDGLLTSARNHVVDFLGGDPHRDRVIFTSGATESINLLLKGYFFANFQNKRKIITSPIEHKAVLETCKYLESIGADLEYVNLTSEGVVDYDHLESLVDEETLFVCLMHVNNETGEVSDLERIFDITKSAGTKFFTDTTQSLTKLNVESKYFDACVGSAHKFHGPKGVGFLFINWDIDTHSIFHGGSQEFGIRSGTHNLPGILSLVSVLYHRDIRPYKENHEEILRKIMKWNIDFKVVSMNMHILLLDVNEKNRFELNEHIVYSLGSACSTGVYGKSHVYQQVFSNNKEKIRISL